MADLQFDENGMLIVGAGATASPSQPTEQPNAEAPATPGDERGLGFYAKEAGRAVVGGIRDGAQEIGETVQWAGESLGNAVTGGHDVYYTENDGFEWLTEDEARARNDIPAWQMTNLIGEGDEGLLALPEVADNETMAGGMARGTVQFAAAFGAVGRGLSAARATTKAGAIARATGLGAVTDFAAFDAHEDRVANFLAEDLGVRNAAIDWLSADEDDTILEGKLKNAIEGTGLGVATDAVFSVFRAFKRAKAIEIKEGPEAAAEVMNEALADMADNGQLELFDALTDPNLRADIADAAPRATAEATETAAEGAARAHTFTSEKPVDTQGLTEYLNQEAGLRSAGSFPDPDRAPAGALFNFDKMDVDADIKDVLNAASEAVDQSLLPQSTSLDEVVAEARTFLADSVDVDPQVIDQSLAKMAGEANNMRSMVVAGKAMVQSLSAEVEKLAGVVASGKASDETYNRFLRMQSRLVEMSGNLKSVITGSAQATSAGRIRTADWLTGQELTTADVLSQMQRNIEQAGGNERIQDIARAVLDNRNARGGPAGIVRIAEGVSSPVKVLNEWYINSILSGPKTHMINVMSNALNTVLLPAERIAGGAMSRDPAIIKEGFMQYMGLMAAVQDSLKMAGVAFRKGHNLLDPEAAILEANGIDYRAIRSNSDNPAVRNVINAMGTVIRLPSRGLVTADEFFKQLNYRSSTYASVSGEITDMINNGKLAQADAAQYFADRLQSSVSPTGQARSQRHLDYAREATFTQELRPGSFGKRIQDMTNQFPLLKLVLPFVRTPTNILKAGLQRTPVLRRLSKTLMADLRSGDPARVAAANGKLVTGSTIWAAAMFAATQGILTGSGPKDPAAKARLLETGWRPNSFKIGDRYVEYKRMDPFAMFLGIAADIAAMGGQTSEAKLNEIASAAIVGLINNVGSKTWLTGISDLMQAMNDSERYFDGFVRNYASAMVPFSAAMREARKVGDPAMREVRSVVDAVQNTIPGLSENLPARRSWVTGQPIIYPVGWGADNVSPVGEALASMNPILQGQDKGDAVLDELASLNFNFSAPTRKIQGVELSTEQYARLNELHGTVKVRGQTLHQRLGATIESPRYRQMATNVSDPVNDPRVRVLQSVISGYRSAAKAALLKEYPEIAVAVREAQLEMANNARGGINAPAQGFDSLIELGQ